MSSKERVRLEAMSRVKRKELKVTEAALVMGVSLRQARRLWKRYQEKGDGGLVHRLRGRASNRRLPEELRERIVKRHQEAYPDFGPTLACEKLSAEGLVVGPDTLTGLLKARQLWVRQRKRGRHRRRRERRANLGSMVQMDGSHHDWFEGRGAWCVLMVIVDDATSQTYARFYAAETTAAAFDVIGRWMKARGLPLSVYVDRHGIYRDEAHPEKPTQFGRAMGELKVELIRARSPQAKGRVERKNRVFQDRLVKELRLRGISDMGQANDLLEKSFLKDLNSRYAIAARASGDVHRPVMGLALEEILCVQEARVVGKDWCVRWRNRWLQLATTEATGGLSGRGVIVRQLAGGVLQVTHAGQVVEHKELSSRPKAEPSKAKALIVSNRPWKPRADHPWKKDGVGKASRATPASAAPPRELHAVVTKR